MEEHAISACNESLSKSLRQDLASLSAVAKPQNRAHGLFLCDRALDAEVSISWFRAGGFTYKDHA